MRIEVSQEEWRHATLLKSKTEEVMETQANQEGLQFRTIEELDKFEAQLKASGLMTEELRKYLEEQRKKLKEQKKKDEATPLYCEMKHRSKFAPTDEFEKCVTSTVDKLLADGEGSDKPGLLLGKIQCGKTNTFENIIALCFDRGIEVCIILTKGTKTLASQTLARTKADFEFAKKTDKMDGRTKVMITDIMDLRHRGVSPIDTKDDKCRQIIICKKEARNLQSLIELYKQTSPNLCTERTLIVDDEADFASRVYRGKGMDTELAKIARLIDDFRKLPTYCRYLQVTATPYSLYLQPDGTVLQPKDGYKAAPFRPRFTTLVPTHNRYIGGQQYYEESRDENSMYSQLFVPVSEKCLKAMMTRNDKYLETTYRSENLSGLSNAISGYFMAAAIRSIQESKKGWRYRSSCLIHALTSKSGHEWESELIRTMIDKIRNIILDPNGFDVWLSTIMENRYADFTESSRKGHASGQLTTSTEMPTYKEVEDKMRELMRDDYQVRIVNSDNDVNSLLDDSGQLSLDRSINIFVGGSILDRGITVGNMLCFFYGRSPRKFQMDTTLQHARMYGARPLEDMAVTRFYTTERIYNALSKIHDIDTALRERFTTRGADGEIDPSDSVIIGYDSALKPCAASKITPSNTTVIKKNSRMLPVGFQTGEKDVVAPIVNKIDEILSSQPGFGDKNGFMISAKTAGEILRLVGQTYVYSNKYENTYLEWTPGPMIGSISRCLSDTDDGMLWCLFRSGRQMSRKRADGRYIDSPEDGRTDLAPAHTLATDRPVLTLLRQEGREKEGWRGTPFYWPVLLLPQTFETAIFSESKQKEVEEDMVDNAEIKELLASIPKSEILHLVIEEQFLKAIYYGLKKTEVRDLQPSDAGKYIEPGEKGHYKLAPGVKTADLDAGIFSLNNGKFPFILRKYKYMLLSIPFTKGSEGKLLVRLKEGEDMATAVAYKVGDDDIVADQFGDKTAVEIDNEFHWTLYYNIDSVLGPRQPKYDQMKESDPDTYAELCKAYRE